MLDFFQANPAEELTLDDLRTKFSVTKRYARGLVLGLKGEGLEVVTVVRLAAPATRTRALSEEAA